MSSLAISLLFFAADTSPPVVSVSAVSTAGVPSVRSWPLVPGGDSLPAFNAAMSWCESTPGREKVFVPEGTWKVSSALELVGDIELCGVAMLSTFIEPLDEETHLGPVVVAGCADRGWGARLRADKLAIRDLMVHQSAATSAASHCIWIENGDDIRLERVRVAGSKHEGLVAGGWTRRWTLNGCEAYDCGEGSPHRQASGAGFNCNGLFHTLTDCTAKRCGQSYEYAGTGTTFVRCKALSGITPNGTTTFGPSIGFNIGNAVLGVYKVRVIDCESTGHKSAISVGNVIGRVGAIDVQGFRSTNGTIAFAGGKQNNSVPHADEGPDLSPSSFRDCDLLFTVQPETDALIYAAYDPIYGRAPLTVERAKVRFQGFAYAWNAPPAFSVSGGVTADVLFRECRFSGFDAASARGDMQVFNLGTSKLPDHTKNVRNESCRAFKSNGTERHFRDYREGPN